MTADSAPAVRPVGLVGTLGDLRGFLAHLHHNWNNDPEVAHALEDEIKTRVLQLVAEGHPDARALAEKVLSIGTWDDVRRRFG